MLTSTITSKGQITLPAKFRREMGVKPSDRVLFTKEGKRVFVEKVPSLKSLYGSLSNSKVKSLSIDDMNKLINKGIFGESTK